MQRLPLAEIRAQPARRAAAAVAAAAEAAEAARIAAAAATVDLVFGIWYFARRPRTALGKAVAKVTAAKK